MEYNRYTIYSNSTVHPNSPSNNITSNTKRTSEPSTPKNKDNQTDTLSSGSYNLPTTISPFWCANRILFPRLTPFQLFQQWKFYKGNT